MLSYDNLDMFNEQLLNAPQTKKHSVTFAI